MKCPAVALELLSDFQALEVPVDHRLKTGIIIGWYNMEKELVELFALFL